MARVRVGIVGSRFQAECVAASARMAPDEAEVVAVASPTAGHAGDFAARHGIARAYGDYRAPLATDPAAANVRLRAQQIRITELHDGIASWAQSPMARSAQPRLRAGASAQARLGRGGIRTGPDHTRAGRAEELRELCGAE